MTVLAGFARRVAAGRAVGDGLVREMDLVLRPETPAEEAELLEGLDGALTWGTSYVTDAHVEVTAPSRDGWTIRVLGEEDAELMWLRRSYGTARVVGPLGATSGVALPPDLARRVWLASQRLDAALR